MILAQSLAEIREAVEGEVYTFAERDLLARVESPLRHLMAASPEDRMAFVFEALDRIPKAESAQLQTALKGVVSKLLRGGLPMSSPEALRLVESVSQPRVQYPYKAILFALEGVSQTPALQSALFHLRGCIDGWHGAREAAELHKRIDALLNGVKQPPLEPADGWSRAVFADIDSSPKQFEWRALLLHAQSLTQSTASRKWRTEAVTRIDRIGPPEFLEAARRWLAMDPMPGEPQLQVPEAEADLQKGFVWSLGALGDASIAPAIADFAVACFRKIPMVGAVSHKTGNACVNALAAMPGLDAVAQLSRLAARVKYDVAQRLIEKALTEAAGRNGVSRDHLEAMSVPGLGEHGAAAMVWISAGKPRGQTAEIKKAAKDLETLLAAQRIRLERQLLFQPACPFDRWRAWYLDHPVVSTLARRLIWEFEAGGVTRTAIYAEGKLVGPANEVAAFEPDASVRLWHPIRSDVRTVLAWRTWLEENGVRQPFKQAHREVYLLTDAERQTADHSNRFASHILAQHQFAALCRERGWQFDLMGEWDSHNVPYLDLPQLELRAEFDVEASREPETSGHGVYLTVTAGRVRFVPSGAARPGRFELRGLEPMPRNILEFLNAMPQPVRLETIPPVVFSEAMRDCDLFTGVSSIGADPAWETDHPGDPHASYWREFAFGELSESAAHRRTLLGSLLPKLAIASRCRLDGRFLVVRGELNEYRIHLGSGNVIAEPGSRYLCIVQGGGDPAANLALPFEGDRILALILSKAILLANDTGIEDESIRRQLR